MYLSFNSVFKKKNFSLLDEVILSAAVNSGSSSRRPFGLLKLISNPPSTNSNNNGLYLRLEDVDLRVEADFEDVAVGLAAWGRRRRGFDDDLALLWGRLRSNRFEI